MAITRSSKEIATSAGVDTRRNSSTPGIRWITPNLASALRRRSQTSLPTSGLSPALDWVSQSRRPTASTVMIALRLIPTETAQGSKHLIALKESMSLPGSASWIVWITAPSAAHRPTASSVKEITLFLVLTLVSARMALWRSRSPLQLPLIPLKSAFRIRLGVKCSIGAPEPAPSTTSSSIRIATK